MIAHRTAFEQTSPDDKGLDKLAAHMAETHRVGEMSDIELADTVLAEVLDVVEGRDEVLVIELLSRFEQMCGIERDEESGEIIPT